MVDLIALLNTLVDSRGHILIPGVYDSVAKLTDEEKKLYEPIDFNPVSNRSFSTEYIYKRTFSLLFGDIFISDRENIIT